MRLEAMSLKRRLCEADLLSGAEGLARRAVHGNPSWLSGDPKRILALLCDTVSPDDLTSGSAALWAAATILWQAGSDATLEQVLHAVEPQHKTEAKAALAFAREYGMGIPTLAPVAARRLLAVSRAFDTLRQARDVAAEALQEAQTSLHGV